MAPEAGDGAVEGVGGEELAGGREGVVEVVEDDGGLGEGAAVGEEEDGDLLVDGVVAEQLLALAAEVLLRVLEVEPLEPHRQLHAVRVRARPRPEQLQPAVVPGRLLLHGKVVRDEGALFDLSLDARAGVCSLQ